MDMQDAARKLGSFIQQQAVEEQNRMSAESAKKAAIIALLGELGSTQVGDDSIEFTGEKITLPASYEGRVLEAISFLQQYHTNMEKHYEYNRTFRYRPWDGAHAFYQVTKRIFGNAGLGKNRPATFFSPERPPVLESINTGLNTTEQVPWGEVEFTHLEATFNVTGTNDPEFGPLFHLSVDAPKKYKRQIEAFYAMVEKELKENSIYRGKAINGAKNPQFLDVANIDPNKVVYSKKVLTELNGQLWSRIRYTKQFRDLGQDIKRNILVAGPYGTGKTLAGMLTAQVAEQNGWTFIICRPGKDNLFEVLQTAQLYAPAVVWFEDVDTIAADGNEQQISKLLDLLDGAQGKGAEVIAGFTTNHVTKLQKGVLRPGRIDRIIEIGELDAEGYEKLVRSLIKPENLGDVDYERLRSACKGYLPAFVSETIKGALAFAIDRTGGTLTNVRINTEDLENSADSLRPQFDLMNDAREGSSLPTLDSVFMDKLADVTNKTRLGYDKNGNNGLVFDAERVPRGSED